MIDEDPRVFISYARSDGEEFATTLRKRLEDEEPEITLWQDRAQMMGGVGWWKQITDALDRVQFMVLVMTPAALESEMVRREWRYARQQGVCVFPVQGVSDLEFKRLPRWMRDAHFYDLEKEWETFVNYLKSPCHAGRVPFMAPDPPHDFVDRPAEYGQLLEHVLDEERQNPIAITTALHGAGGFGKTTLAAALCHDEDVITAFSDGILWVTLGRTPNVQQGLAKLYAALTGERPGFVDAEDATVHLRERLSGRNCLLVVDDIWDQADVEPFLRVSEGCTRLITTRDFTIATKAGARRIAVDEMTPSEAVQMLIVPLTDRPDDLAPFRALAERLGEYPLLLELAGAVLKQRMERRDTLDGALTYLNRALDRRGVVAFDQRNATKRNQAVARTIDISLGLLTEDERERYTELAIFPNDADVSLSAAGTLWKLDEFDTEDLLLSFDSLSLLKFNLQSGTFRLHDVMLDYLAGQLNDLAALHARLVDAWGNVHDLSTAYAWQWLAYHLVHADRRETLRDLLLDYRWLHAKLTRTSISDLLADYQWFRDDAVTQRLERVLRQAAHILAEDEDQLASQLVGRLLHIETNAIQSFLTQLSATQRETWLRPYVASLHEPDTLERTLTGHTDFVNDVAISSDNARVVSAGRDGILIIWDIHSGRILHTLEDHTHVVNSVTISRDEDERIISASTDGTLKIWDLNTGMLLNTLRGHKGPITDTATVPDTTYVISASHDATLRIWDYQSGKPVGTLKGHADPISIVNVSSDGTYVVSISQDESAKVWDLNTAQLLRTWDEPMVQSAVILPDSHYIICTYIDKKLKIWDFLSGETLDTYKGSHLYTHTTVFPDATRALSAYEDSLVVWNVNSGRILDTYEGHTHFISSSTISTDGTVAVSASQDNTLKVWKLDADRTKTDHHGHTDPINDVIISPNGNYAISASYDNTIRVWDLTTGQILRILEGHSSWVHSVDLSPSGDLIVSASADGTLKVWQLESGNILSTLEGHDRPINDIVVSPDGNHAISAAFDHTVKIWSLKTGELLRTLEGHDKPVSEVAVSPDGQLIVSTSEDNTLKFWDLKLGRLLTTINDYGAIINFTFMPDGNRAVCAHRYNHTLKVLDLDAGRLLHVFEGHTAKVNGLTTSADSSLLISASQDNTLRVWNMNTGNCIARFYASEPLRTCALAPDMRTIVAGGDSGRLHFLRLENV